MAMSFAYFLTEICVFMSCASTKAGRWLRELLVAVKRLTCINERSKLAEYRYRVIYL